MLSLQVFGILSICWAYAECNHFTDPLAPRLYEKQEVRYIDLLGTAKATQNITILLDIPNLAEKTTKIKLLLDPAGWGKPVKVQLPMNHTQPSSNKLTVLPTFVHNVAIVDYLSRIGSPLEDATLLLEENYRAVLEYRRQDGSFGTSVFLTAFIVKGLQVATRYMLINETVISGALKWLAENQQPGGQFVEVEPMLYEKMKVLKLTTYVLAIFAAGNLSYGYSEVLQKGSEYVAKRIETMDVYELALASYALSLVNHPKGRYCLEQLNHPKLTGNRRNSFWRGKSSGAEIAGYALMASLNQTIYTNIEDIVQWLKSRPFGSYGGFGHTQGISTALAALAQHYEQFSQYSNDYTVRLRYQSNSEFFHVTSADSRMYELDLPSSTKRVQAELNGTGFGRIVIRYQYYQRVSSIDASFSLNVELLNSTTKEIQNLQVCVGSRANRTEGLTLVEVFFPKGFRGLFVEDISPQKSIWKTLHRSGGTSTVVYYEFLGPVTNCFVVSAELFQSGGSNDEQRRQTDVVAYDYYNRGRVAWVSYKGYRLPSNEDDYEYLEAV